MIIRDKPEDLRILYCNAADERWRKSRKHARYLDSVRLRHEAAELKAWEKMDKKKRGPRPPTEPDEEKEEGIVVRQGLKAYECDGTKPLDMSGEESIIAKMCDKCTQKIGGTPTPVPKDKKPAPKRDRRSDQEKRRDLDKLWKSG